MKLNMIVRSNERVGVLSTTKAHEYSLQVPETRMLICAKTRVSIRPAVSRDCLHCRELPPLWTKINQMFHF